MRASLAPCASAVVISMLSLASSGVAQQTFLNLDFEAGTRGQLWSWYTSGAGYDLAVDNAVASSGKQSLRIRNTGAADPAFATAIQAFPLDAIFGERIQRPPIRHELAEQTGRGNASRSRRIHLAGYIKTSGMTRGYAGYWMRVDGPSGTILAFNNMYGLGPSGTTDWNRYSFDLDVGPDAVDVDFGVLQNGDGTAWFDNLTIDIDGTRYVDGPAPYVGEPTAAQLSWLQQVAHPFTSPNPAGDLGDLWPVSNIVGDAHLVGLGEGTHGTSEFFLMKHRLLEYLAQNKGFTIFAMEANMPESDRVNEYVLTGQGDPAKLLQGLYFWTWNTQEVLNMILWIRQYNAAGNGPILFTGFDMQYSQVAIPNVENFLAQAEPAYLAPVQGVYSQAARIGQNYMNGISQSATVVQPVVNTVHAIWQHLTQNRSGYLAHFTAHDVDWAIQNAAIVEQATYFTIAPGTYRDQAMASNMEWILQQNPGARAVLWAHDGHLWKDPGAMGSYLAATHGTDYVAIGQIFHAGSYNANNSGRLGAWPATPSFPGTVEYVFHNAGLPWFILDLRQASLADSGSAWLLGPVQYRMIGALVQDGFFFSNRLAQDFDALIFFQQSTPSTLLPFN